MLNIISGRKAREENKGNCCHGTMDTILRCLDIHTFPWVAQKPRSELLGWRAYSKTKQKIERARALVLT